MSEELKNCPFCGSWSIHNGCKGQAPVAHHRITCMTCGCIAPSVKAWNTRSHDPAVKALVEAAEAIRLDFDEPGQLPYIRGLAVLAAALAAVKEGGAK